jgi:hypothetical protein
MSAVRRRRALLASVVALACTLPAIASAQAPAPGVYERREGKLTHRLDLRADGTASAVTLAADGTTLVATRFQWRMEGARLLQTGVRLQDRSGEFRATRDDTLLELRNVRPNGFDTRARPDLPWFSWRRVQEQAAKK